MEIAVGGQSGAAMYSCAIQMINIDSPRSGFHQQADLTYTVSDAMKSLLPNLKLLVKIKWLQPITGQNRRGGIIVIRLQ